MNIKLHKNVFYDALIIIIDVILIYFASVISSKSLYFYLPSGELKSISAFIDVAILSYTFFMIFMLYAFEFYTKTIRSRYEICLSVVIAVLISSFATMIVEFILIDVVKITSIMFFVIMAMILSIFICFFKLLLLYIQKKTKGVARLLVIESKEVENNLARKIKYSYLELYESWYIQIDVNNEAEISELMNNTFKEYESIFLSPDIPVNVRDLFISSAVSQYKEIYILPDLYNISVMKNETVQFEDTPALRIKPFGLTKLQSSIKRMVDVSVSFIGIILTFPIMVIVALFIKIDSKGPVIYKQQRVTVNQKKFNVYKFRTMRQDAEKHTGAVLATEDDPRITKVGKVLRSTRLDELPQFFNILFGDMSIVGPRPERPFFVEQYLNEIENYDKRFFAKAGLTGLAQVYARYDTTPKDKTLYDLLYIKDYSFFQDIKLILLTLKIMFVKESSLGVRQKPNY